MLTCRGLSLSIGNFENWCNLQWNLSQNWFLVETFLVHISIEFQKNRLHWFCFSLVCNWSRKLAPSCLCTNQMQNLKPSQFGHPCFPVGLGLFIFWLLVGSMKCFSFFRLAAVIPLCWFCFIMILIQKELYWDWVSLIYICTDVKQ